MDLSVRCRSTHIVRIMTALMAGKVLVSLDLPPGSVPMVQIVKTGTNIKLAL